MSFKQPLLSCNATVFWVPFQSLVYLHAHHVWNACLLSSPVRFYFRNWHGTTEGESPVWRHCISKLRGGLSPQKTPEGTPLLDAASLEYLFSQVKKYYYYYAIANDFLFSVMEEFFLIFFLFLYFFLGNTSWKYILIKRSHNTVHSWASKHLERNVKISGGAALSSAIKSNIPILCN